jgi:hypothetical protein
MPRGGWRFGAGRPGWKATAELSQALDVRRLHRSGRLRTGYVGEVRWINTPRGDLAGSVAIRAQGHSVQLEYMANNTSCSQTIALVRTRCYFRGSRPWFVCPIGGECVAVLYAPDGRFGCRRCQRVAYQSQSESAIRRLNRKQRKLQAKLGSNESRPKGMHHATYDRLLEGLCQNEEEWCAAASHGIGS